MQAVEREFFIANLLVRIHFIIEMIRWTGLAPWEFEFPFPGSLTSIGRAGSILGLQQEYLADNEEYFWGLGDPDVWPPDGQADCIIPSDDEVTPLTDSSRRFSTVLECSRRFWRGVIVRMRA